MGRPVVHFEINGRDMAALGEFFRELFDWQLQPIPDIGYTLVTPGEGPAGGIGQVEADDQMWVTFYVEVDDPQASLDQAVRLGGTVVQEVTPTPGGPVAVFATPEGHRIGVVGAQSG